MMNGVGKAAYGTSGASSQGRVSARQASMSRGIAGAGGRG